MIQNKALRIATGCHQKATASHLRAETRVLPLRAHLELCSQQFYASALQPSHLPRHLRATLQASYHRALRGLRVKSDNSNDRPPPPSTSGACWKMAPYPLARRLLRVRMIGEIIWYKEPNKVLLGPHPFQLTQPNNCYLGHIAAPSHSSVQAIARGSSPTVTP